MLMLIHRHLLQTRKQCHDSAWKDCTRDEIKLVVALCILMGIIKNLRLINTGHVVTLLKHHFFQKLWHETDSER